MAVKKLNYTEVSNQFALILPYHFILLLVDAKMNAQSNELTFKANQSNRAKGLDHRVGVAEFG